MRTHEKMARDLEGAEKVLFGQQAYVDSLRAELASARAIQLDIDGCNEDGRIVFDAKPSDGLRVCVHRTQGQGAPGFLGNRIPRDQVPQLRAWLDHHYPQGEPECR